MAFAANIVRVTGPCGDLYDTVRDATSSGFSKIITPIGNPLFPDDTCPCTTKEDQAIARMRTESALNEELWKNTVIAQLCAVTPLWSGNPEVQASTLNLLKSEILQANHVGCADVCLNLSKEPHPMLADAFKKWLAYDASPRISTLFFVTVPLVNPEKVRCTYLAEAESQVSEDPWHWYRRFRNGIGKGILNGYRFGVILDIPTELRVPRVIVDRWIGEPLRHFILHTNAFYKRRDGRMDLPPAHKQLAKKLMLYGASPVLSGPVAKDVHVQAYIRCLLEIKATVDSGDSEDHFTSQNRPYEDRLIRVPQPLVDDLTLQDYDRFTEDGYKYALYNQAFHRALAYFERKRAERGSGPLQVAILGAGLGPLIDEVLIACDNVEQPVVIHAVEKNLLAYLWLKQKCDDEDRSVPWKGRVRVIHEDCRYWKPSEKLDAIVSDFFGCFGDDQCMTEFVRPVEKFLQEWGVMIPSAVTCYLAPIQSVRVYTTIAGSALSKHENKSEHESHIPWLCNFRSSFTLASATPIRRETFPSKLSDSGRVSGEWRVEVPFSAIADATVHGFAGSFHAILFDDAELTNLRRPGIPLNTTTWSTAFFPLSKPLDIKQAQIFNGIICRKSDGARVWYEWSTSLTDGHPNGDSSDTVIHNLGGKYHSLLLNRKTRVPT